MRYPSAIILLLCIMSLNMSCVNETESLNVQPGNIPITFTGILEKTATKVNATSFETGDEIGLYAMLTPETVDGERYIDNLRLTCNDGDRFIPEKTVFYPDGGAALDFVCYHPYQEVGAEDGYASLKVSVQNDQSTKEGLSKSDFLLAKKQGVISSEETVELNFEHKFAKLQIALVPGEGEAVEDLLADNPEVIVSGVCTQADYNLTDGSISDLKGVSDVVPNGIWNSTGEKLTGKELIIVPQKLGTEGQCIVLDWNGRMYTCSMPELTMEAGTQCEIVVTVTQSGNSTLTGMAGTITDWTVAEGGTTDNTADNLAIHTAVFSFKTSDVYRVYHEGNPVVDVCREYLKSETLTSRAIVAYPVVSDTELPDLTKGTVLKLLDTDKAICGGTLRWDVEGNSFTYEEGDMAIVDKMYVKSDGTTDLMSAEGAVNCDIIAFVIRDMREKNTQVYPVVKIGTQYWMKEDLRATCYRNGKPLEQKVNLGEGSGYFKPDGMEYYYYNGEGVLADELSPRGWSIPTEKDWEQLKNYVGNDASLLKMGEWALSTGEMGDVQPATNLTGFSVCPYGTWLNGKHNNHGNLNGYWSMANEGHAIAEKIIFFTGGSNEFYMSSSLVNGQDYYKALSIRCIKK